MGQLRDIVEAEDAAKRHDPLDLTRNEETKVYTLKAEATAQARNGWHACLNNLMMKPFRRFKAQRFLLLSLDDQQYWEDDGVLHASANIRLILIDDIGVSS